MNLRLPRALGKSYTAAKQIYDERKNHIYLRLSLYFRACWEIRIRWRRTCIINKRVTHTLNESEISATAGKFVYDGKAIILEAKESHVPKKNLRLPSALGKSYTKAKQFHYEWKNHIYLKLIFYFREGLDIRVRWQSNCIRNKRITYCLNKSYTSTHTHPHQHIYTCTSTRTHTHTYTHVHTYAHTDTYTHIDILLV